MVGAFPSARGGSSRLSSRDERSRFSAYLKPCIRDAIYFVAVVAASFRFHQYQTKNFDMKSNNFVADPAQKPREPRKIFIDLGANCGDSYLIIRNRTPSFTEATPSATLPWDVYLWEANPLLVRLYLNDLAEGNTNENTGTDRIHVVAASATTQDTELEFYLTTDEVSTKEEFRSAECEIFGVQDPSGASSILEEAKMDGKPVRVPALDFGKWLHDLNLRDEDRLVLKIDIEGAEVDLLEHMLSSYSPDLCRVERLMVEWHAHIFTDPELTRKHEEFRSAFPEKFRLVCGRDAPLKNWH